MTDASKHNHSIEDAANETRIEPPGGVPIPRSASSLPEAIGKYTVLEELSSGGQAMVYRVLHPGLRAELVLKLGRHQVPQFDLEKHELVAEARLLTQLRDNGISRVHDVGFHDNRPYVVMDMIRGQTLRQVMDGGPLKPSAAAELLAQVARAVAAAHAAGITHRDLKPANVVMDEAGKPYVIDFGLALLCDAQHPEPSGVGYAGTPAYMAPEQFTGELEKIDARTDVFGLGTILFELLTQQKLYAGNLARNACLTRKPPEIDLAPLESVIAPGRLKAACRKALSVDPANRFRDASEFQRAIQPRRHPASRSYLAACLTVIVCLAIFLFLNASQPTAPQPESLQDVIRVHLPDRVLPVSESIPLLSGDSIRVICDVPHDLTTYIWWFDSEGNLTRLQPLKRNPGKTTDRVLYPDGTSSDVVSVAGSPGTELILVTTTRSNGVDAGLVRSLLGNTPLPVIPPNVYLLMNSSRVEVCTRSGTDRPRAPGEAGYDVTVQTEDRLDRLRYRLIDHVVFFAAIAFPHTEF